MDLADYDVVIGSVHLVKYKDLTMAYSQINFSKLTKAEIIKYLFIVFSNA